MAVDLPLPAHVAAGVRIAWRPVRPPYGPRQESAAGRRAASAALAAAGAAASVVTRHADGRPCFPPGFAGSISHTDRLAVAVVFPGAVGVGVDIEDAVISPRVARFVLRERERRTLLVPGAGFTSRELFAAKEAAFKALYGPETQGELLFWRVELSRSGDALEASYRGVRVPVWVRSETDLSLAVALRTCPHGPAAMPF
ncbi:4'-phosphopantetheinyl transferase superfamily protein [Streptomyces rishiriensis]|uniref:4'-phosphopantetheinyl transferase EntD n=1 Tax=Streptomyces rishiriensis TaxID=68264 RepID=A0ABU0P1R7_STRRH|nr:4'-phosphopantetheinyl transferase superfamily protein [Streptomyces rishiriensis]MDQ0585330.1 4'-phosphopantetheinyl transferase EntD [Streptomyces rishiriensis]